MRQVQKLAIGKNFLPYLHETQKVIDFAKKHKDGTKMWIFQKGSIFERVSFFSPRLYLTFKQKYLHRTAHFSKRHSHPQSRVFPATSRLTSSYAGNIVARIAPKALFKQQQYGLHGLYHDPNGCFNAK